MRGLVVTAELAARVGVFIASGIGGFSTIEREHKALLEGWPAPHLSVLHSRGHHQSRGRSGVHPVWRQRTEFRHLHRVLGVGARDRRRLRNHQAQRRRRHDCRRIGSGHHADGGRRIRRHARALDAQRRAEPRQPSVRQGPRRLHHGRRRRRHHPRGARLRATARRADLRRARRLRHVGRRLSHHGAVRGRRRRDAGHGGGAPARGVSRRTASTTSTPTAPRRPSTTSWRPWPSSGSSASTRRSWPSPRPSR